MSKAPAKAEAAEGEAPAKGGKKKLIIIIVAVLMALSAFLPSLFAASESGPGAAHAPILIALAIGLVVGGLCQRSRFCTVAASRDAMAPRVRSPAAATSAAAPAVSATTRAR